jgi:hypothetical protein
MSSSDILVGIKKEHSSNFESYLKDMFYTKETAFDNDFYKFKYVGWNDDNQFSTNLMNFLLADVKYNQYGFIRIGSEPGDVEIHGNLDNFGITYHQEVHY